MVVAKTNRLCFNDLDMLNDFLDDIKDEVVSIFEEFKEQLQGSVSDFKNETVQLKDGFAAELEKIRIKLKL